MGGLCYRASYRLLNNTSRQAKRLIRIEGFVAENARDYTSPQVVPSKENALLVDVLLADDGNDPQLVARKAMKQAGYDLSLCPSVVEVLEDLADLAVIAERRDEPVLPHDEVIGELKRGPL